MRAYTLTLIHAGTRVEADILAPHPAIALDIMLNSQQDLPQQFALICKPRKRKPHATAAAAS